MDNLLKVLRNSKTASWTFALLMGLCFRYVYGSAKHLIGFWSQKWNLVPSTYPTSESQILFLTITFNFIVDLTSSLMAAALCGWILVYFFQERTRVLVLGSALVLLALDSRLWRFWEYPELGMQISGLIGPLLAALVFVTTVCLLQKIRNRITPGSTRSLRAP